MFPLDQIAKRYRKLNAAMRSGQGIADPAALWERYAYSVKDHHGNNALGLARVGAADISNADPSEYYIPFTVTVMEYDRDGDLVNTLGIKTKNYQRNPVWFFGHQEWPVPIGKGVHKGQLAFTADDYAAHAGCWFDPKDSDAMLIHQKVMDGYLNATSIAFVPIQSRQREDTPYHYKSKPRDAEGWEGGWLFDEVDLTEISIVGVPANAGALRDVYDREKGHMTPQLRKAWVPYCAKARGKCFTGWCPCPPHPIEKVIGKMWVEKSYENVLGIRQLKTGRWELVEINRQGRYAGSAGFYGTRELALQAATQKGKEVREMEGSHVKSASSVTKATFSDHRTMKTHKCAGGCSKTKPCGKCAGAKKAMNTTNGTAGGYAVPVKSAEEDDTMTRQSKGKSGQVKKSWAGWLGRLAGLMGLASGDALIQTLGATAFSLGSAHEAIETLEEMHSRGKTPEQAASELRRRGPKDIAAYNRVSPYGRNRNPNRTSASPFGELPPMKNGKALAKMALAALQKGQTKRAKYLLKALEEEEGVS
jgi:hypothetical protein